MSYEIIKNLKVMKDENGGYYARIKSASSNVTPRLYLEWDYCKGKGFSKEELEKTLYLDFYHGEFQGGSSKYNEARKIVLPSDKWQKANRLERVREAARRLRFYKKNISEHRKEQLDRLMEKLYAMFLEESKNVLYKALTEMPKIAFTIRDKGSRLFVTKINKYTYRRGTRRHVFTGYPLYTRILSDKFWKEGFDIEIENKETN